MVTIVAHPNFWAKLQLEASERMRLRFAALACFAEHVAGR